MKKWLVKWMNPEVISYLIFGVLTTLVDWLLYALLRHMGLDYRFCTALSWFASVIFAYVTNKLFVFRNYNFRPSYLLKECAAFFACRISTGVFNFVAMLLLVDGLHSNEYAAKAVLAVAVIVLNYVGSKLFIFRKK
ncbi:MAG: GtrA family protein [bacterium]|nr:GtrA family protein [bacterium]